MAKEIKAIQCPKCGSTQKTEIRPDVFVCTNCNTEYYLDNDDININVRQVPAGGVAPVPAGRSELWRAVTILVVAVVSIIIVRLSHRNDYTPPSPSAYGSVTTGGGDDDTPTRPLTWHSADAALTTGAGGQPVLVLAGQRDTGGNDGFDTAPAVGYYDARTGKLLKLALLPAPAAGQSASTQLKQFSTGTVDVLHNKQVYAVDATWLAISNITPTLLAGQSELSSGLADIGLGNNEDDMFYVFTNDGHHYNLYPLTRRLYTNDELGEAKGGFGSLRPGSPTRTGFTFTGSSLTYPDDPIQLISYQYRDNGGGPKTYPDFSWDDDYGGSGIFTDADPHVKRLITPYQMQRDRVLSYRDFTPGRLYFGPAVLYADDQLLLITFHPTAASDSPLAVQGLNPKTGAIVFTTPLPATASRPDMALRYAGGFVIGHDQQTYTLSTTGQLGPVVNIP